MGGLRRIFYATVSAFCLWRGARHSELGAEWKRRAAYFHWRSKRL